uniref:(northern house mosquito) hypothetical protein n=1 Tax=Culex pipiens TaxID=7175 RepID=A0A8D8BT06_CULPI
MLQGVVLDTTTTTMVVRLMILMTVVQLMVLLLSWCLRWRRSFSTGSVQLSSRNRHLRQLGQVVQFLRNVALHFLNHLVCVCVGCALRQALFCFVSVSLWFFLEEMLRYAGRKSVHGPFQLVLALPVKH